MKKKTANEGGARRQSPANYKDSLQMAQMIMDII